MIWPVNIMTHARCARRYAIMVWLLAFWLLPAFTADADGNGINALKAAFVLRFVQFVDWPPEVFANTPDNQFVLCVYGTSSIQHYLTSATLQLRVGNRHLTVLEMDRPQDVLLCQAVFVPAENAEDLQRVIEATRGHPVLTMSDTSRDQPGLMIRLFEQSDRLAFAIRPDEAHNDQLLVSAQLLRLARIVE